MENFSKQEDRLRIGPLGKVGHFRSTSLNYLVYIASISSVIGPLLNLTSWNAEVLHAQGRGVFLGHPQLVVEVRGEIKNQTFEVKNFPQPMFSYFATWLNDDYNFV
jgi:hypothetical protein